MWHATVLRELRPEVISPPYREEPFSCPAITADAIFPHLPFIQLSISKDIIIFETIQTEAFMERHFPLSFLRAFSLIIAFAVASSALTVSGQDSRSAIKADSAKVISLDAMLDHVDAVVRRLEERSEGSTSLRSASSPSGYVGTIPMTAGVSPSGARTYSIPIMTVDVPGGAPAVSLEYNSQGGHGAAGYGWEIG